VHRNGRQITTVNTLTFTDNHVINGVDYIYTITASYFHGEHESEFSNAAEVRPDGVNAPILPPRNLRADFDGKDVVLSWDEPEMEVTTRSFMGYNVYRGNLLLNTHPIRERTFTDEDVPHGSFTYNVKAIYSGGESEFVSFPITIAVISTFPFTEGFEGTMFPPFGWTVIDNDGDGRNWFRYDIALNIQSGNAAAGSASWDGRGLTPDNWLITPSIQLPTTDAGKSMMLKYYVRSTMADTPDEHYAILVSTTGTSVESFTEIFSETLKDNNWARREISLLAFEGQFIYIAFRHYKSVDKHNLLIDDVWIGVDDFVDTSEHDRTQLIGNFPNPFRESTTIEFFLLNSNTPTTLKVYNIRGQRVKTLVNSTLNAGLHPVIWDGTDDSGRRVRSGIYFYHLRAGNHSSARKMLFLR
jgi:hypothetical protein